MTRPEGNRLFVCHHGEAIDHPWIVPGEGTLRGCTPCVVEFIRRRMRQTVRYDLDALARCFPSIHPLLETSEYCQEVDREFLKAYTTIDDLEPATKHTIAFLAYVAGCEGHHFDLAEAMREWCSAERSIVSEWIADPWWLHDGPAA